MTGTSIVHVPYKDSTPASPAVISGEVQLVFSGIMQGLPHMRSWELKALGVSTAARSLGAGCCRSERRAWSCSTI